MSRLSRARSLLDSLFEPFERTADRYSIAIFRIGFFGAVALHFFPSLVVLGDHYSPGSARTNEWSNWLFVRFGRLGPGELRALSVCTLAANTAALVGVMPRISALFTGVGLYCFASFNAIHLQTLALITVWANLSVWVAAGGGNAVLSLPAAFSRPRSVEKSLLGGLLRANLLIALFFSGIEKLLAGWPVSNELAVLFSYPNGSFLRSWVVSSAIFHSPSVCRVLAGGTLFAELGSPVLLLIRKTRFLGIIVYETFFAVVVAMLSIPLLFYVMFAVGGFLFLEVEPAVRRMARHARA